MADIQIYGKLVNVTTGILADPESISSITKDPNKTLVDDLEALSSDDSVRYSEQTLTDEQKKQARENIGAGTSKDVKLYVGSLGTGSDSDTSNGTTYIKLYDEGAEQNFHLICGKEGVEVSSTGTSNSQIQITLNKETAKVVGYGEEQSLNESEQIQARQNIGVESATDDEIKTLFNEE